MRGFFGNLSIYKLRISSFNCYIEVLFKYLKVIYDMLHCINLQLSVQRKRGKSLSSHFIPPCPNNHGHSKLIKISLDSLLMSISLKAFHGSFLITFVLPFFLLDRRKL